MPSAIDVTVPVHGNPTTESVRDNFAVVKNEMNNMEGLAGLKLNRSGDEMEGPFTLWGNPTQNYHAANMSWVLNQIKSTVNTLVYVGDYDGAADRILTSGQPQFVVGTALPLAGPQNSQFYFTVTTSSAPTQIGNQPVGGVIAGTWLTSNGESWTDFAMTAPGVTAQTVPIEPPIANVTADNVYDALAEIMSDVTGIQTDYVSIARGGTMRAMLTLFDDPANPLDAAPKRYVDAKSFVDAPNDASYYGRNAKSWAAVLPIVGGTLTGNLTAPNFTAVGLVYGGGLVINGPATNERSLYFETNSSPRWYASISSAEQGGDAGGIWSLAYCNDNGAYKSTLLYADRLGNLSISPTVGLSISAPSTNFLGSVNVSNNKTLSTTGQLAGGFGLFGKGGGTRGGFVGSWNPTNNNYYGIWTESGAINFGSAELTAGVPQTYFGGIGASGLTVPTALIAGTSVTSNSGRILSQSTGNNSSLCCYDTSLSYAAGMFLGGGKNLYFGNMDGNGNFIGPTFGYFTPAGDLNITGATFVGGRLYVNSPAVSDFNIFRGSGGRYFQWATNWYDVWRESDGLRVWYGVGTLMTLDAVGALWCNGTITSNSNVYAGGSGVYYPALGATGQHGFSFAWTGSRVNVYVDNVYIGQMTTSAVGEDETVPDYTDNVKRLAELTERVEQLEAAR